MEFFNPANRFIVDGEIVIKLDGFLMIEKDVKLCKFRGHGNQLCIDLWNQDTKDFTVVADGKEIKAHKFVLFARSPVFAAMLKPHTLEAQENKVTIPDFSFNVVEAAIKFCYDSSLVPEISLEDKISILQFFDKYDIQLLKADMEQHLVAVINEENVCSLVNSSIISNAPILRRKCSKFLEDCFRAQKSVNNFDLLDNEFAFDFLKNSVFKITQ